MAYRHVKRCIDFACALTGIAVTSPLWVVAVLGILVSDPGPVFYRAKRIGRGNRSFNMFKFRSMTVAKAANERSLRPEESRIFPFGHIIRRLKMDELPQLLNILKGEMSIIGPRPVATDQFEMFRTGKWNDAAKVNVGLSGPAALYDYLYGDDFTDEKEYMEKVYPTRRELEYAYVGKMGFLYDARMTLYTVIAILYSAFGKKCEWMLEELVETAKQSANDEKSLNNRRRQLHRRQGRRVAARIPR